MVHYIFAIWVAAMVMAGLGYNHVPGAFWIGLGVGIVWWLLAKKFE